MPDRHATAPVGRIAVVDVGSNSLRLVVFERLGASLLPLLNEKVMCALGRGIARTGRLNPDGVELAFANLQRFVALARALKVDHLAIIATAAVREASDGDAFAAEAQRQSDSGQRRSPGRHTFPLRVRPLIGIPILRPSPLEFSEILCGDRFGPRVAPASGQRKNPDSRIQDRTDG